MEETARRMIAEITRSSSETVAFLSRQKEEFEAMRKEGEAAFKEQADSAAAVAASLRCVSSLP